MEFVYVNGKIKVYNNKKECVCEVIQSEKSEYFLKEWYFLKANINTDKYIGSFKVKHQ